MHNRLKVGELLVHAGVIDEMQLRAALGEQARWGRRLGVTLIKLGMVEENHLIRALAQQLGLPATSLSGRRIAKEVIALVPARVATQHSVIPLFIKRVGNSGKLFLGMEDPSKLEVLDDICFRTGLEIQPVMMGPTEIGQAIDRYYRRKNEVSADSIETGSGETTIGERSLGLAASDNPVRPASQPALPERSVPLESHPDSSETESIGQESIGQMASDREVSIDALGSGGESDLMADVDRAVHGTEKTRLVLKAVTQLLVDKGILSLDEIQSQIDQLRMGRPKS